METEQKTDETRSGEHVKLAQLYKAMTLGMGDKHIKRIIDQQSDLNLVIPENSIFKTQMPGLVGSTLLHFALAGSEKEAFDYLLEKCVDYTMKNAEGSTALHETFEYTLREFPDGNRPSDENSYVDSILCAHVKDDNFANPCNSRGISHLHAACAVNDTPAVELFLQNGASVSEAVNADSPVFPGYTPMHFAARYGSAEVVEILLKYYEASSRVKDATGATPLHVLVREQLLLIDERNKGDEVDDQECREKIGKNERIMKSMLKIDENVENVIVDDSGLSLFHVACTLLDTTLAERLSAKISDIHHSVQADSPFWPGYTALHFAALSNIDTVKLLLDKGANVEAKSTDGTSPFDMCLERYGLNDISYIIACHPIWKDIRFLDSQVTLVNFIDALHNTSKLIFMARNFLITTQSSLPLDSPLWPGSTPLHLAVRFFERKNARFYTKEEQHEDDDYEDEDESTLKVIKLFFNTKHFEPTANILAQDAYGRTPIHLAYPAKKIYIQNLLLDRNDKTENPIDIDNVSLLHLACLLERDQLIEELLFIGEDANMPVLAEIQSSRSCVFSAGSTPLHIAVLTGNRHATKKLLASGADPFAQDVDGITPIHQVLASGSQRHCQTFVSTTALLNVTVTGGVSYLHVACIAGDREAVKKLIELGADINAPIGFELPMDEYSTKLKELLTSHVASTPLHFAMQYNCVSTAELLISRGADLFVSELDDRVPIVQILTKKYTQYANVLLLNIQYNHTMRENLQNKTGLTLLHIACNALDVPLVRRLLDNGAEVNAKARSDSPVWPGCTALHVVLKNLKDRLDVHGSTRNPHVDNVHVVLKLLTSHGADVTLKNADDETSIDLSTRLYKTFIRAKTWLCTTLPLGTNDFYDLNFVDDSGITLFQEACYQSNVTVIQEFLKRGVDVNQRVDALTSEFAGYTPLHFAAKQRWRSMVGSSRHSMTMEILLGHKADVRVKDVEDNTPLHILVKEGSSREELISRLIKFGADLNALNIYGQTPFEVLLRSSEVSDAEVAVFLKNGARLNSYNCVTGMGYIPLTFESYDIEFDEVVTAMIENAPDITDADDEGRTIIHNILSCSSMIGSPPGGFSALCARFIERGCDIDQQDKSGKTALHTAVKWQHENAVSHLLTMNANASIVDNDGKTALDYATESCTCDEPCDDSNHLRYYFALQAFKFELTGFQELSAYRDLRKIDVDRELTQNFRRIVKKAKKTYVIPGELTLYDFASETGAVSSYLHMPILKRKVVDEFFKSMNNRHYGRVAFWLRSHYGKAVARAALVEPAKQSLNSLIGFSLPHLCSDGIFRFLSNVEMKNLIAASVENLDGA